MPPPKLIENKTLTIGIVTAIALAGFIWTAATVWNQSTSDRWSCREMELWREKTQAVLRREHPNIELPEIFCEHGH